MVLISYMMCWLVSTVGSYGLEYPTDFTVVQKMPILSVERRKYVTPLIKFFFKGVMFGFGVFHVQVKNLENLSDDAKIVTFGPHSTLFDTAIIYAFGRRTFSGITAAAEFFRPLSGKMLRIMDYVGIDYKNPKSRQACVDAIIHRATSADWKDILCTLACEGGTHSGIGLAQFKRGAFLPGLPVQPMSIEVPEWIDVIFGNLNRERFSKRGAGWAGWTFNSNLIFMLWYQLAVPWQPFIVRVLPVYRPSEEERENPMLFGKGVRKVIAESLGCPVYDTTHVDGYIVERLWQKYSDANLDAFRIDGAEFEEKYGLHCLTKDNVATFLDEFMALSSTLSFKQFLEIKLTEKTS